LISYFSSGVQWRLEILLLFYGKPLIIKEKAGIYGRFNRGFFKNYSRTQSFLQSSAS
jgi:hypothetical protein